LIKSFNSATTKEEIKTLLDCNIAALDISGTYGTLTSDADKLLVADAVLKAKNNTPFTTIYDVAAIVNNTVNGLAAINAINAATSKEIVKGLLDQYVDVLAITGNYSNLPNDDKLLVAAAVFRVKANDKYISTYGIKAIVDNTTSALSVIKEINAAVGAVAVDAIKLILDDNTKRGLLGIKDSYSALSNDKKVFIAQAIYDSFPSDNDDFPAYATTYEIAGLANNSINVFAAVEEINKAADVASVKNILDQYTKELNISGTYGVLTSNENKLLVAKAVLDERLLIPGNMYQSPEEIAKVVENALLQTDGLSAVNNAQDIAQTRLALENNSRSLDIATVPPYPYSTLSDADKNSIAATVYQRKQTQLYTSSIDIKNEFNKKLTSVISINKVVAVEMLVDDGDPTTKELNTAEKLLAAKTAYGIADEIVNNLTDPDLKTQLRNRLNITLAAINNAKAILDAIKAINNAATADALKIAVQTNATVLNLDMTGYQEVDTAKQSEVWTKMFAEPATGFADKAAIQVALDAAVEAAKVVVDPVAVAVNAVNNAATAGDLKIAVETNTAVLTLDMTGYATVDPARQSEVWTKMFADKPATGFADKAAIQVALDAAVEAAKVVADPVAVAVNAVNNAATADALKIAVDTNKTILTLDMTGYATVELERQSEVWTKMFADKPATGFADKAAIQAALDAAVVAAKVVTDPVGSVIKYINDAINAIDVDAIKLILDNKAKRDLLGIKEAFSTLSNDDKIFVAQAIFDNAPTDNEGLSNYTTASQIAEVANQNIDIYAAKIVGVVPVDAAVTVASKNLGTLEQKTTDLSSSEKLSDAKSYYTNTAEPSVNAVSNDAKEKPSFLDRLRSAWTLITQGEETLKVNDAVSVVNSAATADELKTAVNINKEVLGLDMAGYQEVDTIKQSDVWAKMFADKPATGFADKAAIQATLNAAVNAAKTVVAQGVVPVDATITVASKNLGTLEQKTTDLSSHAKLSDAKSYYTNTAEPSVNAVSNDAKEKPSFLDRLEAAWILITKGEVALQVKDATQQVTDAEQKAADLSTQEKIDQANNAYNTAKASVDNLNNDVPEKKPLSEKLAVVLEKINVKQDALAAAVELTQQANVNINQGNTQNATVILDSILNVVEPSISPVTNTQTIVEPIISSVPSTQTVTGAVYDKT